VFDASTNSNGIPNQVVTAILGSDFGRLNGEATLIAWSKTPVAALNVEGGRGSDVTLWIVRAPKVSGTLASRTAQMRRVSFEPFSSNPGPNGGGAGYAFYDGLLPEKSNLTLRARGTGLKPLVYSNHASSRMRWLLHANVATKRSRFGAFRGFELVDESLATAETERCAATNRPTRAGTFSRDSTALGAKARPFVARARAIGSIVDEQPLRCGARARVDLIIE
jgi:hypothetical protein